MKNKKTKKETISTKVQEELLKQLVDIRVMTDWHLDKVEETTGEVTDKDLLYCQELGLRILAFKINNL